MDFKAIHYPTFLLPLIGSLVFGQAVVAQDVSPEELLKQSTPAASETGTVIEEQAAEPVDAVEPEAPVIIAPPSNPIEALIRQRAEALDKLEADRNTSFRQRAELIVGRETALVEREKVVANREAQLNARDAALAKREAALTARETLVAARENLMGVQESAAIVKKPKWPAPSIVGKYCCVIDAVTGTVLFEKAGQTETAVASTQKLMTALIVIEAGDLDTEVVIEAEDTRVEPTIIGVKAGQKYTRRELVKALLVRSGNDIAKALARDNAGSVDAFAVKMNARALTLGMTNSNFMNPHGLTEKGQHSTARDMALLARACYAIPFVRECVSTKQDTFTFNDGSTRTLVNTNKVLSRYSACNGMKTGYTSASGNCLVSSAEQDGRARIVVVLGSNGTWIWKDSQVLLEWAIKS